MSESQTELTDESKALLDDLTNRERRDVRLRYGWNREEIEPRLIAIEAKAREQGIKDTLLHHIPEQCVLDWLASTEDNDQ